MLMQHGLIVVLCLLASASARGETSAYTVDGLALGERLQSNGYGEYNCAPSDQFEGFTWCQKSRQQRERRRSFNITHSLLHSRDGRVVYVNRFQAPAFFGPKKADEEIQQYSHRMGESPRIIRKAVRAGDAIIAVWGAVDLKPLDSEGIAALGSSSKNEYLIDLIGNVARSAKEGLPIYRISGGAGFLWIASFGRKGLVFYAWRRWIHRRSMQSLRQRKLARQAYRAADWRRRRDNGRCADRERHVRGTRRASCANRNRKVARRKTQLNATIQRLEAEKAAGEAKAHQMAKRAFGTMIVLVVLAGIGAFAFVPRQRNGHASKLPSVIPETEEVPLSKPTNITEIELATAGDPKQINRLQHST